MQAVAHFLPLRSHSDKKQEGIELLGRLSLGGKKSLLLVSVSSQRFLIGVSEDGAPSIASLGRELVPSASRTTSRLRRDARARGSL